MKFIFVIIVDAMPEGPEATFISYTLNKELQNKTLDSIKILKGRYVKHGPPNGFNEFIQDLPLKLIKIGKKGKVILFYFDNDWCIISKLGLMGWWYTKDKPEWRSEYINLQFHFDKDTVLTYSDTLSYGTLTFTKIDSEVYKKEIDKLGLDILDRGSTFKKFITRVNEIKEKYKNKEIEEILTDQEILISGIGNYLKAEILYDAKISPLRLIKDISDKEWKTIFDSCKKISRNFKNALSIDKDGKRGYYEKQFKVYSQEVDPLGNKVAKFKTKTGRTTHWVPVVQI